MAHESTAPSVRLKFHSRIQSDLAVVLEQFQLSEETRKANHAAFTRLRELVRSIGNGDEYDLEDISLCRLKKSGCIRAPLECAIVDKTRPEGLPPLSAGENTPLPYDALALTRFLGARGYQGTLIDILPNVQNNKGTHDLSFEREWSEEGLSASSHLASDTFGALPPVLRIAEKDTRGQSILLNPVHPTHMMRFGLLARAIEAYPEFSLLLSSFWLWLQSWGIAEYPLTACAFTVLYFFQKQYGFLRVRGENPSSSTEEHLLSQENQPQRFWMKLASGSPTYQQVPTVEVMKAPIPDDIGTLLYNFFDLVSYKRLEPHSHFLDPITGVLALRLRSSSRRMKDKEMVTYIRKLLLSKDGGKKDGSPESSGQPRHWKMYPLVIKDPFLPQHNVAYMLTRHGLCRVDELALRAASGLRQGFPVFEIFGSQASIALNSRLSGWSTSPNELGLDLSPLHSGVSVSHAPPINDYFKYTPVPDNIIADRSWTIKRVQEAIGATFGKQYRVECFGSTCYRVDNPRSDLDLVVLDPERMHGWVAGEKELPAIYNMKLLAKALEKRKFKILRIISFASVPVVKFEDRLTNIACDVNVNEQLGLYNTKMIAKYCEFSPLLVALLRAIKTWAKSFGLNDPSGSNGSATFSSYSLTLMTIGFLQSKQFLPNLQANLLSLTEPDTLTSPQGFYVRSKYGPPVSCDYRFQSTPAWTPPADSSAYDLKVLLQEWFRYWGEQFDYTTQLMSIRDGGVIVRPTPIPAKGDTRKREGKKGKNEKGKNKTDAEVPEKSSGEAEATGSGSDADSKSTAVKEGNDLESMPISELESLPQEPIEQNMTENALPPTPGEIEAAQQEIQDEVPVHDNVPRWGLASLVVADPFIIAKNTTNSISSTVLARFRAECNRAAFLIEAGMPFDTLLGDGTGFGTTGASRLGRIGAPRGFRRERRPRSRTQGRGDGGKGPQINDENDKEGMRRNGRPASAPTLKATPKPTPKHSRSRSRKADRRPNDEGSGSRTKPQSKPTTSLEVRTKGETVL